ncbi:MAG: hypothetical protein AAGH15_24780, partial [Myxococcota bacterium]
MAHPGTNGAAALTDLLAGRLAQARSRALEGPPELRMAVAAELGDAAAARAELAEAGEGPLAAYARGRLCLLAEDVEGALAAFDDAARSETPELAHAAREAAIEALLDRDGPVDASAAATRLAEARAALSGPEPLGLRWLVAR